MALLLAALCASETPGAEITSLFSLIQDPSHRYQVYSRSAHGGHASSAELSASPGDLCVAVSFSLHGGKLHGEKRSGAGRGLKCSPGFIATTSVVFLAQIVSLSRAGEATQVFPARRPGVWVGKGRELKL